MSGPKGYGYAVVSAAELRRREDEARRGRCDQQAAILAGLIGQLEHYGQSGPKKVKQPSVASHEGLIAWESELQRAIADVQEQVRQASAKAIMRRLNASKAAVDTSAIVLDKPKKSARPAASPKADPDSRPILTADVDKLVEVIAQLRDPHLREELTAMSARVLQTADLAQAKGDLLTVKTRAATALRVQGIRDLAAESVLTIAHIASPEADRVRALAAGATSTDDVSTVKREVQALAEAEACAADAGFVQSALMEVLEELGFAVAEGFRLEDLGRAVVVADHADHPGYGLRLQVNPSNAMMYTRLVGDETASPADDAQAEADTCAKVHAVAEGLRRRGVAADLRSERQPGERPIDRRETPVASTMTSAATSAASERNSRNQPRRRPQTAPHERSM